MHCVSHCNSAGCSIDYAVAISPELFATEEAKLRNQLAAIESVQADVDTARAQREELAQRVEAVATVLRSIDIAPTWDASTPAEKRILVDDLVDAIYIHPNHLGVVLEGVPPLEVLPREVGLKAAEYENNGVGGATRTMTPRES